MWFPWCSYRTILSLWNENKIKISLSWIQTIFTLQFCFFFYVWSHLKRTVYNVRIFRQKCWIKTKKFCFYQCSILITLSMRYNFYVPINQRVTPPPPMATAFSLSHFVNSNDDEPTSTTISNIQWNIIMLVVKMWKVSNHERKF